jgi:hypothetical protein
MYNYEKSRTWVVDCSGVLQTVERYSKVSSICSHYRSLFIDDVVLTGSTVLCLEPEMMVPYSKRALSHCHVCFSDNQKALACCPGCNLIRYCSKACEEADRPLHHEECKALKNRNDKFFKHHGKEPQDGGLFSGIIRLTARLIWKRAQKGEDWWKPIDGLCYQKHSVISGDPYKAIMLAAYIRGGQANKPPSFGRYGFYPVDEVQDQSNLLARVNANAFEVVKKSGEPVGQGLSTVAAMLNHSCDANCSIEYPDGLVVKKCMYVIARKDIKAGEQLSISYSSKIGPFPMQKENIGRLMNFECKCSVCKGGQMA